MQLPWITGGSSKIIAIVGICKNAGKTTVLNALIKHYDSIAWGVMSTGRDGESTDTLYKTPKPEVVLNKGSIFCADGLSLNGHGSGIIILERTPWQSGGKRLYLAMANQTLQTEILGPASVSGQISCAKRMLALGAAKILIDGSLDRKSIALSEHLDGLILVAGASFGSMNSIVAELRRLMTLAAIPLERSISAQVHKRLLSGNRIMLKINKRWIDTGISSLIGNEKELASLLVGSPKPSYIYIPGAYSSRIGHKLESSLNGVQCLFRHPECLKISLGELDRFTTIHQPRCLIPFAVKAVAINAQGVGSQSFDAAMFRSILRNDIHQVPTFDIMEV